MKTGYLSPASPGPVDYVYWNKPDSRQDRYVLKRPWGSLRDAGAQAHAARAGSHGAPPGARRASGLARSASLHCGSGSRVRGGGLLGAFESSWEPLGAAGPSLYALVVLRTGVATRLRRAAQGCTGLHRAAQGGIELRRAAHGCTGLHMAAQGCAGLCRAAQVCTELRRDAQCQTGSGLGRRVEGAGCRVEGAWCRMEGAGWRVQGGRCKVQGGGCMVEDAGRRQIVKHGRSGSCDRYCRMTTTSSSLRVA